MIRATAIPGRQRHGTEKNRSAIRKRRAIPRRELSFPVFLFFPRPSFRHSSTGIFNFPPLLNFPFQPTGIRAYFAEHSFILTALSQNQLKYSGKTSASGNLPEKVCPVSETYHPCPSSKRDFPRGESLQNPKPSIFRNTIPGIPRIARTRRKRFPEQRGSLDTAPFKKKMDRNFSDPFPKTDRDFPRKIPVECRDP